jgi:hypothetical protein
MCTGLWKVGILSTRTKNICSSHTLALGFFFLAHFLCMTEGFMAMNVFVITGQIAAASLEMMAMQHYAYLPFAKPAQLSEHRLKSALLTLAERK